LNEEFLEVREVAALLEVSPGTITRKFQDYPGVIDLGSPETPFQPPLSCPAYPPGCPRTLPDRKQGNESASQEVEQEQNLTPVSALSETACLRARGRSTMTR
jgi:hypothetical protein